MPLPRSPVETEARRSYAKEEEEELPEGGESLGDEEDPVARMVQSRIESAMR
jgi:hypothetical protein